MDSRDYVSLMYQSLLGRAPDAEGLAFYADELDRTGDLKLVVDALTASEEYRAAKKIPGARSFHIPPMQRPLLIVDVGAQSLADESHIYAPLLRTGIDWRCIGFEPLEHRREERLRNEGDPRLQMMDAFIGDGNAWDFHVVNDDGSSSLLSLNTQFNRSYEHIHALREVSTERVQTKRLDDVLKDEPRVDYLKFDIQGFEGRALAGATEVLKRTNVIHAECFFGPMYHDQAFFADIDQILRASGFDFIDFTYSARYRYVAVEQPSTYGERMIWSDAVYFRRLTTGVDAPDDFSAQALIADTIYRKPGLAQSIVSGQGL